METGTKTWTDKLCSVDASILKQWLDQDIVTLIDVREPSEYAGERIQGAISLPLSTFEPQKVPNQGKKKLVLYCESSIRSGQAAQKLLVANFGEVAHLKGGLNSWKQLGYPIQKNKNAPISIMRQVQIVTGSLILTGTLLGAFVSPWFLLLSGFVGAGLLFAGISNTCALAMLLGKLPYNQRSL
jgi:rhodanese-related sulfurtransferase